MIGQVIVVSLETVEIVERLPVLQDSSIVPPVLKNKSLEKEEIK